IGVPMAASESHSKSTPVLLTFSVWPIDHRALPRSRCAIEALMGNRQARVGAVSAGGVLLELRGWEARVATKSAHTIVRCRHFRHIHSDRDLYNPPYTPSPS